jgi:phosphoglycerate dehydrogenase-like enzyme
MSVKVVVVDAARLPAGVEFPPLEAEKYGWEQYLRLDGNDIAERCWRADIVVTLGAAIDSAMLQKMHKVGLLICAAEACAQLDQDAARARGIELLAFPEAGIATANEAQDLCDRVCAAINHYLRMRQPSEAGT